MRPVLGAGQQKESSTHAGGRVVARVLLWRSCWLLARRGRGDASAGEPDACPSQQGCADPRLPLPASQHSAAVAELGSSDAGGLLLLLRGAAGIHWG